jgi:hypothetical protein
MHPSFYSYYTHPTTYMYASTRIHIHAEHYRYFATEAEIVTPRAFEVSAYRQALLLQDRT